MFIETLEFTIPMDLCDVFATMKKGLQSNVEFPASVNSYGTTQDANVQVFLRANKLTFKVDGVSSESSIISKSECKTLKLSVFDVDKSLMPFDNNEVEYDTNNSYASQQQSISVPSLKRVHEQSVSIPSAKSSRSSYGDSPRPSSPVHRRKQNSRSSPPRSSSPPSKHSNNTPVNVKSEPEDPDLIEIEPDAEEELVLKDEIPYMQVDYSATGPDATQTLYSRASHTQSSSSSSFHHESVPHVPDYAAPGPSHHGDQSADDYLVYQGDDIDEHEGNYSNDEAFVTQPASQKFIILGEEKLDRNLPPSKSKSTMRPTNWGLKIFTDWLTCVGRSAEFEKLSNVELNRVLSDFYAVVRTPEGKLYSLSSFAGIRTAIYRHLIQAQYDVNILSDFEFAYANNIFASVSTSIAQSSLDISVHDPPISEDDLNKIRDNQRIDNPVDLQAKVWFDLTLGFRSRGKESQRDYTVDLFAIEQDETGSKYITMCQQGGRVYATGNSTCPVLAFKKYVSKLHPENPNFFQKPKETFKSSQRIWYTTIPLGRYALYKMMKTISKRSALSIMYSNKSVRATIDNRLSSAGQEEYEEVRQSNLLINNVYSIIS